MYKIVGADRREYGPVTREAVFEWIAQGRANAQTIARFEDGAWKPLGTFEEFKSAFGAGASTTASPPPPTSAPPPISSTVPPVNPTIAPTPTGRETNQMAIWALVCSILGLLCCPCMPIVGLILGIISLNEIKRNPARYSTDDTLPKIAIGIAVAGILIHCGVGIFSNAFQQMGKGFRFR